MRFLPGLFLVAMAMMLSSCFTTYQVESNRRLNKEQARIIIYRKGIIGYAIGTNLYADGKFMGKVGANRYVSCWLPAGEHLFSARFRKRDEVFFKVNMVVGGTYGCSFTYGAGFFESMPHVKVMTDTAVVNHRKPPVVYYFH